MERLSAVPGAPFTQHSSLVNQTLRSENRRLRHKIEQLLQRCHVAESANEKLLGVLSAYEVEYGRLYDSSLDMPRFPDTIGENESRPTALLGAVALYSQVGCNYELSGPISCNMEHETGSPSDPSLYSSVSRLQDDEEPLTSPTLVNQDTNHIDYYGASSEMESSMSTSVTAHELSDSLPDFEAAFGDPGSETVDEGAWDMGQELIFTGAQKQATSSLRFQANALPNLAEFQPRLLHEPFPTPSLNQGFRTGPIKGVLDEFILTLGHLLNEAAAVTKLTSTLCHRISSLGVQWVVREAWPEAEQFWKLTASMQGFHQAEMFRNFPSARTYSALHPAYRPTKLQLSIPHAAIIDWLPWPDLRDQVIAWQDQIDVDLVCRTAIENVVAHRRTTTKKYPLTQPGEGEDTLVDATAVSFRVLDLCLLEQQSQGSKRQGKTTGLAYKPTSAAVCALEKAYALEYDEFHTQRLHPSFFEQYPALYCESAVSAFQVREVNGVRVRDFDVGRPRCMSRAMAEKLSRSFQQEMRSKSKSKR